MFHVCLVLRPIRREDKKKSLQVLLLLLLIFKYIQPSTYSLVWKLPRTVFICNSKLTQHHGTSLTLLWQSERNQMDGKSVTARRAAPP